MSPKALALLCFALALSLRAEEQNDLAPTALKYGEAMVQHWLTVDLAQQLDRAAFYHPQKSNAEIQQLTASLSQTEEQLDEARSLYKKLYKKEVTNHLDALDQLLNAAITRDKQNADQAKALLTRLGQQVAGKKFNAMPVPNDQLAPAWTSNLIGKDFKPKRIIFGSTGSIGDNRTLPLRFDFGSGVYGAYIGMKGPGELDIPEARRNRTDGIYPWMEQNHEGYHYWAGVYNNQNTYVAKWFLAQHTNDDIWMRLVDGKIPSRGDWAQVNIWNKDVQSYLTNYCETQGRTFREDPSLVCYDYTGEPHPFGSQAPGLPQYSGYNDSAIAAFRDYLRTKFKTIERLNKEWESSYANFDAINPPPDPSVTPEPRATALSTEFRLFRRDSHTALWKRVYDAYRKGDPHKPIEANISQFMSGWPVEGLDAYGMQKAGVADWVDMHMNNFPPNLPEQIYLYSICRLTGKVPVQFEYVWSFPRNKAAPFDDNNESDFRTTCTASVWRNLVWGKKALVFFDFYYDWPAYHNAFFDRDVGYSILRPSGCVVPTTKRKMLRFNDLLMTTEVAQPPIIVLQPDASVWNSPALHPNQSFSHHINIAMGVHKTLFSKNYPFLYVPENAVLEDHYELSKHKVIILPDAPYLPKAMTEKLLAWIKSGGTLITVGIPGIWTPYGKDDMALPSTIFGKTEVRDTDPGKWKWDWKITEAKPGVQLWKDGEKLIGASANYGKGRVLVSVQNIDGPTQQQVFRTLEDSIGLRPASCANDSFELVLREDKHSHRYLFILNPDTRETKTDQITVAGTYKHCTDLGFGSGVPVPLSHTDKTTTFSVRLTAGEGTVVAVGQ